jgi:hypothetical protein
MMHSLASAAKLRGGEPILCPDVNASGARSGPRRLNPPSALSRARSCRRNAGFLSIKDRSSPTGLRKFSRISVLKSCNIPVELTDLSCPNAALSSAIAGQSLPQARQGLRELQSQGACILAPCLDPTHAQKAMQSSLNSLDGLLTHARKPAAHATGAVGCLRRPRPSSARQATPSLP